MAFKDYLPDFKGALNNFYDERLKDLIENKSTEYKKLLQENFAYGQNTQKALIAIALGIFLLLAIAYFWSGNSKYFALGILEGYLAPYIYHLTQKLDKGKGKLTDYHSNPEEN